MSQLQLPDVNPRQGFQFLGIPPKGEPGQTKLTWETLRTLSFQFLGIPPKGELSLKDSYLSIYHTRFPISRDPPEGGTVYYALLYLLERHFACFQFLGIPPKGEHSNTPLEEVKEHLLRFPISRDPPEGGTWALVN